MDVFERDISEALRVLRGGGVILYPTDTIWGLGCDGTNESAVERIFEIKRRADSKALILLLDAPEALSRYVSLTEQMLAQVACTVRPTTFIYPAAHAVAPKVIASDGSVAIRITRERFTRTLVSALGKPLVSTSANISGQPAPAIFSQIASELFSVVDYVCAYRRDDVTTHTPSRVVKWVSATEQQVLRE